MYFSKFLSIFSLAEVDNHCLANSFCSIFLSISSVFKLFIYLSHLSNQARYTQSFVPFFHKSCQLDIDSTA